MSPESIPARSKCICSRRLGASSHCTNWRDQDSSSPPHPRASTSAAACWYIFGFLLASVTSTTKWHSRGAHFSRAQANATLVTARDLVIAAAWSALLWIFNSPSSKSMTIMMWFSAPTAMRVEICVRRPRQSNRIGIRPSWGAPGGHRRRWLPLARERKRHYSAIWRWPHRGMHARVMGSNFEGLGLQATNPRAKWWHSFFEERWLADTLSVDWAAKDRAETCSELVRVLTFSRS